ncbi:hypothetical protein AEGHOMDF_3196 [Methylobacterium soli]|nr:hypothetical protein AEGHOMDF_3196 [Methylobacterium soli]
MNISRISIDAHLEGDLDAWDARKALDTGDSILFKRYCLETAGTLRSIGRAIGAVRREPWSLWAATLREIVDGTGQDRTDLQEQVRGSRWSWMHPIVSEATQFLPDEEVGIAEDWTATTSQVREALRRSDAHLICEYLRDLGDVLQRLHVVLGTDRAAPESWQLTFRHRRPGKPAEAQETLLQEDAIAMAVRLRLADVKKLEAAVYDVGQQFGLSRAVIMRALKAHKSRR